MDTTKRLPRPRMEKLLASSLSIDHGFQRNVIQARVKSIAENLDLDGLGIIVVSRREDGSVVVIDGQHRIEALRYHGFDDEWKVDCRVYSELTEKQEAALYLHLNNTRRITAWDEFKAGMVAEDERCLEIDSITRGRGLKVSGYVGEGRICCVSTLNQIYDRYGPPVLDQALEMATSAWGHTANAVEKDLVHGLAIVANTYNGVINKPWMVKKLAKAPGAPSGLLGRAKALKEVETAPIARLVAKQIVALYNKGKRSNQLGDLEKAK